MGIYYFKMSWHTRHWPAYTLRLCCPAAPSVEQPQAQERPRQDSEFTPLNSIVDGSDSEDDTAAGPEPDSHSATLARGSSTRLSDLLSMNKPPSNPPTLQITFPGEFISLTAADKAGFKHAVRTQLAARALAGTWVVRPTVHGS